MVICTNCSTSFEGDYKYCPSCGTPVVETQEDDSSLIGRTLNRKYRIEDEIGSGSMGTVYLAEHIGLKKRVAIKVLRGRVKIPTSALRK